MCADEVLEFDNLFGVFITGIQLSFWIEILLSDCQIVQEFLPLLICPYFSLKLKSEIVSFGGSGL